MDPKQYKYSVVELTNLSNMAEGCQESIIGKANAGWEHYDTTSYVDSCDTVLLFFRRKPKPPA